MQKRKCNNHLYVIGIILKKKRVEEFILVLTITNDWAKPKDHQISILLIIHMFSPKFSSFFLSKQPQVFFSNLTSKRCNYFFLSIHWYSMRRYLKSGLWMQRRLLLVSVVLFLLLLVFFSLTLLFPFLLMFLRLVVVLDINGNVVKHQISTE